jgi:hypothetical protein
MFFLPGGVQLFVLLNIPILFMVFMGYRAQLLALASAQVYTGVLAVCCGVSRDSPGPGG